MKNRFHSVIARKNAFDPYTVLLVHMDGEDGGTTFLDRAQGGSAPHLVTANGDAQKDTAQPAPFADGVTFFDQTGDTISVTDNLDDFEFGSGQFTIEMWCYVRTGDGTGPAMGKGGTTVSWSATDGHEWILFPLDPFYGDFTFHYNTGGSSTEVRSNYTFARDGWHHIAVSQDASNIRMFVDGDLKSTNSAITISKPTTSNSCRIGGDNLGNSLYDGYLADVRVIKGTGLYTSSFTAPTARLTDVTNTVLLASLKADTDGSTTFTDISSQAHTLTANGDTHVTKDIYSPYETAGPGVLLLDGTGDYLSIPDFDWRSGNWTIEGWFRFDDASGGTDTLFCQGSVATEWEPIFFVQSGGTLYLYLSSTGTNWDISNGQTGGSISSGVWYHIALTFDGSAYRCFVSGTLVLTVSSSTSVYDSSNDIQIGYRPFSGADFDGYIDEYRVSTVARYTSNFTPPTEPFLPAAAEFPASDDFSGTDFNTGAIDDVNYTNRWNAIQNVTASLVSGKLRTSSSTAGVQYHSCTKVSMTGDFYEESDITIIQWGTGNDPWSQIYVPGYTIGLKRKGGTNVVIQWYDGSDHEIDVSDATTNLKVRIRRVSGTIYLDYDNGGGWTNAGSKADAATKTDYGVLTTCGNPGGGGTQIADYAYFILTDTDGGDDIIIP